MKKIYLLEEIDNKQKIELLKLRKKLKQKEVKKSFFKRKKST